MNVSASWISIKKQTNKQKKPASGCQWPTNVTGYLFNLDLCYLVITEIILHNNNHMPGVAAHDFFCMCHYLVCLGSESQDRNLLVERKIMIWGINS